ncbi:MAG: hypothetical protein PHP37_01430 [Patescibacteria group bacterium]|nr:hypothetical protein [Patescibacteria group bacterium]
MKEIQQSFEKVINTDQEINGVEIDGRFYTVEELAELRPIILKIAGFIKEEITKVIPADQLLPGTNYLDLIKKLIIACSNKIKNE